MYDQIGASDLPNDDISRVVGEVYVLLAGSDSKVKFHMAKKSMESLP